MKIEWTTTPPPAAAGAAVLAELLYSSNCVSTSLPSLCARLLLVFFPTRYTILNTNRRRFFIHRPGPLITFFVVIILIFTRLLVAVSLLLSLSISIYFLLWFPFSSAIVCPPHSSVDLSPCKT